MINWGELKEKYGSKFEHIIFDLSKLSKNRNVRNEFGIAENENIIAFITQKLLFYSQESIVFTDQAIYYLKKSSGKNNKITWSDACGFIVVHGLLSYSCNLINPEKKINLTESKLAVLDAVLKAKQGKEIIEFIRAVQTELVSNDNIMLDNRKELVNQYFTAARSSLEYNILNDNLIKIMESISEEKMYASEAYLILGENAIKTCDRPEMLTYIKKLESCFKEEELEDIYCKLLSVENNFVYKLKDSNEIYPCEYINSVYKATIDKKNEIIPEITLYQQYEKDFKEISLYVYLRKYPYKDYKELEIYLEENAYGFNRIDELYKFCCIQRNLNMQNTYSSIAERKAPDSNLMCGLDGMGLTALHYAFAMKDKILIEKMSSSSLIKSIEFEDEYNEIADVLNISIVAKYFEYDELSRKLFENSKLMKALKKSRKKYIALFGLRAVEDAVGTLFLEAAIMVEEKRKEELKENDPYAYNRMMDAERLAEIYYDDEDINESARECVPDSIRRMRKHQELYSTMQVDAEEKISELEEEIKNIDLEIKRCREIYDRFIDERVNAIKTSKHPFVRTIIEFYQNPSYLLQYLNGSLIDYVVIDLKGYHFFVSRALAEEIEKWEYIGNNCVGNEKQHQGQKLYGDSWFSENAHKDAYILTMEYRDLAKIYHPDVNLEYEGIFTEINVERAEIIEKMK